MTAPVLTALGLAAAGLLALPRPPLVVPASAKRAAGDAGMSPGSPGMAAAGRSSYRRRAAVTAVGTFAVAVLTGVGPWWLELTLAAGVGAGVLRLPERTTGAERFDDHRRLAVHADLLAACLDAGMGTGPALLAVPAPRLGHGRRQRPNDPMALLQGVAALLALGADPEAAWQSIAHHDDLAALAAAAKRSSAGGAAMADAVREHASRLRSSMADQAQRSAGRAGVAMTAPLGLCFLPAFLCLGLAPVIVGLLATLHLF